MMIGDADEDDGDADDEDDTKVALPFCHVSIDDDVDGVDVNYGVDDDNGNADNEDVNDVTKQVNGGVVQVEGTKANPEAEAHDHTWA